MSEAYRLANRTDDAVRVASQVLAVARDGKRRAHEAWALRALGEIASHRDPPETEQAEAFYRQAMILADERRMRPLLAHCRLGLGKLYRRLGKRQQAAEYLTTAAAMYREMQMQFWLGQAEVALS